MHPEEMVELLTSMEVAAEVVEAIDNPDRQARHGWHLAGWTWDFSLWGDRFLCFDERGAVTAAVVAVALPEGCRAALPTGYAYTPWPTRLLLLG